MTDIKIKTSKEKFEKIFNCLAKINDEAIFDFDNNRLLITCYSKDSTAFLTISIQKEFFEIYEVNSSEKFKMLINQVSKVIGQCSSKITMDIKDVVNVVSSTNYTINAKLPVIMGEETPPMINENNYDNSLRINISDFKRIIGTLTMFSNFISINMEKDKDVIISSVDGVGSLLNINLPLNEDKYIINKDLKLCFNADKVKSVLDYLYVNEVLLEFSKTESVKLEYNEENIKIKLFNALVCSDQDIYS